MNSLENPSLPARPAGKQVARVVAGLGVSALFLYLALRGFDFERLRLAVTGLKPGYLALGMVMFTGVLALRAWRWHVVINSMAAVPYRTIAPTLAVGYLANNVLPARGGEIVRAAVLSRQTGIPFASTAGTLIADRTTDLVGLVVIMLIAAQLLPWDRIPIRAVGAAAAIGLTGMFVATRVLGRILPSAGGGFKQKLLSFAAKLGEGFSAIRSPLRVAALIAISICVWLLDAMTTMVISRAAGFDLTFVQSAGLLVGIAMGVAIPAAPGYVGTFEFFGKETLTMMGFDPATALTFVVLLHFFQLAMMAAIGIPSLFLVGRKKNVP